MLYWLPLSINRMARLVLNIDPEVDFDLWALVTPLPDYRLCYFMNKVCSLSLARLNDLNIWLPKGKTKADFSAFGYADSANYVDYFVLANGSDSHQHVLLPEMKQVDFLLLVKGTRSSNHVDRQIKRIQDMQQVQTIFPVNAVALHSVNNLIFDNEDLYKNQNSGYVGPGFQ